MINLSVDIGIVVAESDISVRFRSDSVVEGVVGFLIGEGDW